MTYIISYIIISIITMIFFIELNKKQMEKNYLDLEEENSGEPSNEWFNFYIFTHILKAPLMFPIVFLLILGNGGKIDE